MASNNNASFQYKICGYLIDTLWLAGWGGAQKIGTSEDFNSYTKGTRVFNRTTIALEDATFACGVQAHKGGILSIGPEDADDCDLCVYVATNSSPEDATLPDEDTMTKVKTLLGRKMDEEPQWYESTTAISGRHDPNRQSINYLTAWVLVPEIFTPQVASFGSQENNWKQGFIKPEDFGEIVTGGYEEIITGARALDSTVTALEEAIKGLGIKEEQGGIGTIGREEHHPELCAYVAHNDNPGREEFPDENTMMKLKALLELRMDEEPQWYESTTATRRGD
ncbi:hypothetical protein DFH11DRAFT_1545182 [Phellopilus nigrolimitatus]|nr:hypothetical protein DFH11DRAFT_1545182 [Phellopilus nigrolimitatus]